MKFWKAVIDKHKSSRKADVDDKLRYWSSPFKWKEIFCNLSHSSSCSWFKMKPMMSTRCWQCPLCQLMSHYLFIEYIWFRLLPRWRPPWHDITSKAFSNRLPQINVIDFSKVYFLLSERSEDEWQWSNTIWNNDYFRWWTWNNLPRKSNY